MFKAKVVSDSVNQASDRITSVEVTLPRIVLAELNTHRAFTRNSASSRAIPYRKMVREVLERPFIPMAFQKDHSGMQGTEYFDEIEQISIGDFMNSLLKMFKNKEDADLIEKLAKILEPYQGMYRTPVEWWLMARDKAVESSLLLSVMGVSKQLCNRILEPFMWHKVLITSTEWENFFNLRCPQYYYEPEDMSFSTRKMYAEYWNKNFADPCTFKTDLDWLLVNRSSAEIHIARAAELIYEAIYESNPVLLQQDEWHMPYGENMDPEKLKSYLPPIMPASMQNYNLAEGLIKAKIATARAARLSYQTLGDNPEINYDKDMELHDDLLAKEHMSPFEHCAQARPGTRSRNFRGFLQYREIVEFQTKRV